MRFNIHLRSAVREQISQLAETMKSWEEQPRLTDDDCASIEKNLAFFPHTTQAPDLFVGGSDGSGDFPAVSYGDSFVYVSVAQSTLYASSPITGLREVEAIVEPLVHFAWLPEEAKANFQAYDEAFAYLAGKSLEEVIELSDYRHLKAIASGKNSPLTLLKKELIRPHASDTGNVGLQLRSTAELGATLRLIQQAKQLQYVLIDTTLSLPLVTRQDTSLFYEHLKRLCCVEARQRGIGLFALSKSHGLPAMELIEEIAQAKQADTNNRVAEHWYLRLPIPEVDRWHFGLGRGRRLPPIGAVTYLVRFHRNVPVMRLDMDRVYWETVVLGKTSQETRANEQKIFTALDYTCHDQRAYGYPYPIKSAHDRVSLTKSERVALRKQIIDAAVEAGMTRALFRDVSMATGHR